MNNYFLQLLLPLILIIALLLLKRRYSWKLLQRYRSPLSGNIDISRKYNGELALMTNSFVQGVSIEHSSIEKSYWYTVAEEIITHCENRKQARVLFIGLGANTSSLLINQNNPSIHQVIVEIDPHIIQACRKYFHLNSMKNTEVLTGDIFDELTKKKKSWAGYFDCIVIDTFDATPPYLMKNSHDPVFLKPLADWLKSDGMFIFNIPIKTQGINVPTLIKYLKTQFKSGNHRVIHDPRGYHNHFITAEEKR